MVKYKTFTYKQKQPLCTSLYRMCFLFHWSYRFFSKHGLKPPHRCHNLSNHIRTHATSVSLFSYAPVFQGPHFLQKCWNRTFSTIIYLLTFYLFDDIKKYWNHSCESFCYVKGNFDKNMCNLSVYIFYFCFALCIIHGDRCDRKTPKTIILFK